MDDIFNTKPVSLDDLIRTNDAGRAVCKVCGNEFKALYTTDKGYVCKEHK